VGGSKESPSVLAYISSRQGSYCQAGRPHGSHKGTAGQHFKMLARLASVIPSVAPRDGL